MHDASMPSTATGKSSRNMVVLAIAISMQLQ